MPFLWLEDVYLTAPMAEKMGVKVKQIEKRLFTKRLRKLYTGTNAFMTDTQKNDWGKGWQRTLKYSKKITDKLKNIK